MASLQELRSYAKYPFTESAKRYLEETKIDFEKVDVDLLEDAFNRITSTVREKDVMREIDSGQEHFLQKFIISYPLSKVLVGLSKNLLIKKQFAKTQARLINHFLQYEDDATVFRLSKELFGSEKIRDKFSVPFYLYLKYLPEGKDFKLVNQELKDGKILADKNALGMMIAGYVADSVTTVDVDQKKVPKLLLYYADELRKHKKYTHYGFDNVDLGEVDFTCFPPCMQKVYSDLQAGQPVAHNPRFVLATFFVNINMPIDVAIDTFRTQENFNEKRTRYHLEHAYGIKGQRIKYSAPACAKIDAYGICCRNDTCKWNHPISYYKAKKQEKEPRRGKK